MQGRCLHSMKRPPTEDFGLPSGADRYGGTPFFFILKRVRVKKNLSEQSLDKCVKL